MTVNVERFKAHVQKAKAREQLTPEERARQLWRPTVAPQAQVETVTFDDLPEWKERNGVKSVTFTISPTGEIWAEVVM